MSTEEASNSRSPVIDEEIEVLEERLRAICLASTLEPTSTELTSICEDFWNCHTAGFLTKELAKNGEATLVSPEGTPKNSTPRGKPKRADAMSNLVIDETQASQMEDVNSKIGRAHV